MKLSLLLSICMSPLALGASILVMLPLSPKSHVNTFMPLFKSLAARGHHITLVSPYPLSKPPSNWTNIPIKNYFEEFMKNQTESSQGISIYSQLNKYSLLPNLWGIYLIIHKLYLNDGTIQKLLDQDLNFDLMIAEAHYIQEFIIIFGHIYDVPVINLESHFPSSWSCYLTGNTCPYSYVPNYKTSYSEDMGLFERFDNTLISLLEVMGGYYFFIPQQEKLVKEYLHHPKIKNLPPLIDLLKNTSFTLIDSHFSLSYPRPYASNVAEVGGLTIEDNVTLGIELQNYMNGAENGVIYFSFGSILPMQALSRDTLQSFLLAFKSIKQNILMKWEGSELDKPSNVKTIDWAPQQGILAHPKCVLFISHGGSHSLAESVYHGVPLLIIPFFSDQHFNAKFAEANGLAYVLPSTNISSISILDGINTVLKDPRYKKSILKKSLQMRDRPMNAVQTGVYWVEYILKHGASHLRPKSVHLSIFTYLLVDVILCVTSVIFASVLFIFSLKRVIFKVK